MTVLRRARRALVIGGAWLCLLPAVVRAGTPPAQKLPSALLVFPLIEAIGNRDTRIELLNLSGQSQVVQCFYVDSGCGEIGFFVYLTPYQPLSWLASTGLNDPFSGSAAPPFFGTGEMKCAVVPFQPQVQFHNAIQGRAIDFGTDGTTVSYSAVGFQRLSDGDFTGVVSLDGVTYAQCPDKLHFDVLADQPGSASTMILVPCSQDLLLQIPTAINVQFLVTNEFEQSFSTSLGIRCFEERTLGAITDSLNRATLGTATAHVLVRGVGGPLLGLVIDSVPFGSAIGTAGNEPSLQGGRSATVVFP